jgi:hypothetical protein
VEERWGALDRSGGGKLGGSRRAARADPRREGHLPSFRRSSLSSHRDVIESPRAGHLNSVRYAAQVSVGRVGIGRRQRPLRAERTEATAYASLARLANLNAQHHGQVPGSVTLPSLRFEKLSTPREIDASGTVTNGDCFVPSTRVLLALLRSLEQCTAEAFRQRTTIRAAGRLVCYRNTLRPRCCSPTRGVENDWLRLWR